MAKKLGNTHKLQLFRCSNSWQIQLDLFKWNRNIGIFGTTKCGKSILLKGIIKQALKENFSVVGIEYKPVITKRTYLTQFEGVYWSHSNAVNDKILLETSPFIFSICSKVNNVKDDDEIYSIALTAINIAKQRVTKKEKSLFFLDGYEIFPNYSRTKKLIDAFLRDSENLGILFFLTAQSISNMDADILKKHLTIRLLGKIAPITAYEFERVLAYPDEVFYQITSESFYPKRQEGYSSWLLDICPKDEQRLPFSRLRNFLIPNQRFTWCRYYV